jgi:oxygen-independent coproporphyrinogen-3 oxidase
MAQIDDTCQAIAERESIDFTKAAAEFMFLGLRMTEGIRTDIFRQRFGQTPREFYPQIDTWIDGDLLVEKGGFLRFTTKGLLLANSIFVHFM